MLKPLKPLKPSKHSVAVAVFNRDRILAILRPDDDDELPGIWGLPAGTYRDQETLPDLIARIGRDKLGAVLVPGQLLASGSQERSRYHLMMELWEASIEGIPNCPRWQWTTVDLLQAGAAAGSLCCELAIKIKSRVSL